VTHSNIVIIFRYIFIFGNAIFNKLLYIYLSICITFLTNKIVSYKIYVLYIF
jgi:hypothetical protein